MTTHRPPPTPGHALRRHASLLSFCALALLAAGAQAQVIRCTDPVTGKVSYTDGKCSSGSQIQEIEGRKSPEQIQAEREQAEHAQERRRERLQQDAREREQQEQQRKREQEAIARSQQAQQPKPPEDPAYSQACAQARRNLEEVQSTMGRGMYDEAARLSEAQRGAERACLTPDQWVQAQRERERDALNNNSGMVYSPYPYGMPPPLARPPHRPPVRPQPTPKPPVYTNCNVFRCTDAAGNVYPR